MILGSGEPMTSWILAIWSTSFEPGNNGCKLKRALVCVQFHQESGVLMIVLEDMQLVRGDAFYLFLFTSWLQKRHIPHSRCPFWTCNTRLWGDIQEPDTWNIEASMRQNLDQELKDASLSIDLNEKGGHGRCADLEAAPLYFQWVNFLLFFGGNTAYLFQPFS